MCVTGASEAVREWDEQLFDDLFADNVLLDNDQHERRAAAAQLRAKLGRWQLGPLLATTATSGSFTLRGELGDATVSLTLSPEIPPRIQSYDLDVSE